MTRRTLDFKFISHSTSLGKEWKTRLQAPVDPENFASASAARHKRDPQENWRAEGSHTHSVEDTCGWTAVSPHWPEVIAVPVAAPSSPRPSPIWGPGVFIQHHDKGPQLFQDAHTHCVKGNSNRHGFQFIFVGLHLVLVGSALWSLLLILLSFPANIPVDFKPILMCEDSNLKVCLTSSHNHARSSLVTNFFFKKVAFHSVVDSKHDDVSIRSYHCMCHCSWSSCITLLYDIHIMIKHPNDMSLRMHPPLLSDTWHIFLWVSVCWSIYLGQIQTTDWHRYSALLWSHWCLPPVCCRKWQMVAGSPDSASVNTVT